MSSFITISLIKEVLFIVFLFLGLVFCLIGIIGLLRFKDIYSKQHALALIDSTGCFFICVSLAIKSGLVLVSFKPILLSLFIILISAPTCYTFMQILIQREQDKTLENLKQKEKK